MLICTALTLLGSVVTIERPNSFVAKVFTIVGIVCTILSVYALIIAIGYLNAPPPELILYDHTYILKE